MTSDSIIDRDIAALFQRAERGKLRGRRVARVRRLLAYTLKAVAAGGSLVVATNVWPGDQQGVGIAILVAVLVDSITSNHRRLISEVKAGYAYEFLAHNIGLKHNRELDPLVGRLRRAAQRGEPASDTEAGIDELKARTHKELADGIAAIEQSRAEQDVKALEAISLDNERASARQASQGS